MLAFPSDIRGIFTDLDGTLTTDGALLPSTYDALAKLRASGLWTVIATGRPAGWADCLLRLAPVDAVIFENGAGYYTKRGNAIELVPLAATDNSPQKRARLFELFERCRAVVPSARLATDQPFRLFDVAIDIQEEVRLSASEIDKLLRVLHSEPDVIAKPSSAHINFLYGNHTKRTGASALLSIDGKSRCTAPEQIVFVGDSLNDEPLFELFTHSVGVANVANCWEVLSSRPKQTTKSPGGKGFEELAFCLLTR